MISASRCLARTRSGGLCQRAGSPKNGRSHCVNEGLLPKGWRKAFDIALYLLRR